MGRLRTDISFSLLVLLWACSPAPEAAEPSAIARDTSLSIQTGELRYELQAGDGFWEVTVDFTFTNLTEHTVYVPGCRGPHPPSLQRFEDGVWVFGWGPFVFGCLDVPPLSIAPTDRYSGTLHLDATFPGEDGLPKFKFDPPDGIYRLVWELRESFDESTSRFGPSLPLEVRVSNSFEIATPD